MAQARPKLSNDDKIDWLQRKIPHRLRICLANTDQLQERLKAKYGSAANKKDPVGDIESTNRRCETDCIWEARLAAMRWLIGFVGIAMNDRPKLYTPRKHDIWIKDLKGGDTIPHTSTDGAFLAEVWLACTLDSSK